MGKKARSRRVEPAAPRVDWPQHVAILIVLAVVTLGIYWQIGGHEFITYDDPTYIVENPNVQAGLNGQSIAWAFSLSGYAGNWHPLTWMSHMLDIEFHGLDPQWHHLNNLFLHVASAVLLYLLLFRLTNSVWRSLFVAALFALHPLHIESVAWAAERKDVLSTFFWMLALLAYVSYARRPSLAKYLSVAIFFVLGLLAKPMLVTLPLTLLLLDWWPLQRFQAVGASRTAHAAWPRLLLEKVPLLALSGASSFITMVAQERGGAVTRMGLSLPVRLGNAVVSCAKYIGRMFWPARLSIIYPHPGDDLSIIHVVAAAALLIAVSVLAVKYARNKPYLLTGWFWYLITLVPVIGIIQVGFQGSADRYTYVPLIGLFIAITWGVCELADVSRRKRTTASEPAIWLAAPASIVVVVLAVSTCSQLTYWQNSETLFRRAVQVAGMNYATAAILVDLGVYYEKTEQPDRAIAAYQESLQANPDNMWAYRQMGALYLRSGKYQEALDAFLQALKTNRDNSLLLTHIGNALCRLNRDSEAIPYLKHATQLDPGLPEAHAYLGIALITTGDLDEAIRELRQAVVLKPELDWAHWNLATTYFTKSQYALAWDVLHAAQRIGLTPPPSLVARLSSVMPEPPRK